MHRLALAALALAASAVPRDAGADGRRTLNVAAAASLRPVMAELGRAFEDATPSARVRVTFGASGTLVAQIRNGAPFDVFLSADRDFPRRLAEERLGGPEVVYAIGRLVVWAPAGSPHGAALERSGLAGLASPAVRRIAIANPAVAPFGRAAIAALRAAGILDAVRGRLVLGESVSQAAQFAESGAADAAILPASVAAEPALATGRAFPIPPALHAGLEQSAVVLARAKEPELARAFLALVVGPRGRDILVRHRHEVP